MFQQFIRQFHFTKAERHGAVALFLLAGLALFTPLVYRQFHRPAPTDFSKFAQQIEAYEKSKAANPTATPPKAFPFNPNTATVDIFVQLGLSEKVARTIVKYRTHGGKFHKAADLQKIYTLQEADFERLLPYIQIDGPDYPKKYAQGPKPKLVSQPFPFDPNTATESELSGLGLPEALVVRLLRYREKGGRFFEKTDFRKLYGLRETDYQRLEPYISISRPERTIRPAAYAGGAAYPTRTAPLDINTATVAAWQQLPGIGAYRAQQIVRFREKLGGFVSLEQLAETKSLPDSIFQKIRSGLVLKTPMFRKINLNTASTREFSAHPYFSFKQGQLIVAFREQHGAFSSVRDLEKIIAFTDREWLERTREYLTVEE